MATTRDAEILARIRQAFAECARPEHFTDYRHCDECAEHDEVLRSRELETLSMADVGNPGWDPICFVSPEGFRYYLPALARLALAEPAKPHGWYGPQFFFHLSYDGPGNVRVMACSGDQRRAVGELLEHILKTRLELTDSSMCLHEFQRAMECWSVKY